MCMDNQHAKRMKKKHRRIRTTMLSSQQEHHRQEEQKMRGSPKSTSCDAYFEDVQARKKLSMSLQENLTTAFAVVPASAFPQVPGGQVIEIMADTTVGDAVKILSDSNILAAPVRNPDAEDTLDWREKYLGIIDYTAITLRVLECAELSGFALSTSKATAAGVGAGAVGALGAMAVGATSSAAVAGLTFAAVGAAVTGGVALEGAAPSDATAAASSLGQEDFFKVIVKEEPFKSTKVRSIVRSYHCAPFLPVLAKGSMLSVMLLLSKYRMKNVPVIEPGSPLVKNFITQSAVIQGLEGCKGTDWFHSIAVHPIGDLGLPFMSSNEVVTIQSDELVMEAFKRMRDNKIGGLPVVQGSKKKIVGNVSLADIRYLLLKYELFSKFKKLTMIDFLNTITSTEDEMGKIVPPVTCKLDTTLGTLVHTIATKSVHRIYVVDDEDDVSGVITLRDVISCFVYEPPDHFDKYLDSLVTGTLDH